MASNAWKITTSMKFFFSVLCALLLSWPANAHPEIVGRLTVGYQGWFAPTRLGDGARWVHYGGDGAFEPGGKIAVEMWPDVSEFPAAERVPTNFRHADGSVASVFDAQNADTVNRHFEWMKNYGIGGAWLQRFAGPTRDERVRVSMDKVLDSVRAASRQNEMPWALMVDLSGVPADDIFSTVAADWKRLVDAHIRDDANYLFHQNKPVVALWGIGFSDNRPAPSAYLKLIDWLKNDPVYGGNAVVLGVPFYWRSGTRDAVATPDLKAAIQAADVIFPWPVGRYNSPDAAREVAQNERAPDIVWAREHDKAYMPGIFPGFSWHNLMKSRGKDAQMDEIPRLGGEFLWAQAVSAKRAGATMLYVAMFDEIDEGTAIFKVSNDALIGDTPWLTLGSLPSDHYLWLTGEIAKILRGEIPATDAMPMRKP